MKKDWKDLKVLIHKADIIAEVVDARDVTNTRLPVAERMSGSKRLFIIVNKSDLTNKKTILKNGMMFSAKFASEKERRTLIGKLLERTDKRPARALFVGYPNVGKSSIINLLARKKAARVAPVAGTTKNVQWINISEELKVTDYRGIWPQAEKKEDLARKGAIELQKDAIVYAQQFAERIMKSKKLQAWAEKEFDIKIKGDERAEEVLSLIATRRNLYIKGGGLNLEETARILTRAMKEAPEI